MKPAARERLLIILLVFVLYLAWILLSSSNSSSDNSPAFSEAGFQFYSLKSPGLAVLTNLEGKVLNRWPRQAQTKSWHHVELLHDGSIIAIEKDTSLTKMSWNSVHQWTVNGTFHHDLVIEESGNIWTLERLPHSVETQSGEQATILGEYLTEIGPDGTRLSRTSLVDLLLPQVPEPILEKAVEYTNNGTAVKIKNDTPADIFHVNSLDILSESIPGIAQKGDFLISALCTNGIFILSRNLERILWKWKVEDLQPQSTVQGCNSLDGAHAASFTDQKTILYFSNGRKIKQSAIREIDPRDSRIVWECNALDDNPFYASFRGAALRLADRSTLVTVTDSQMAYLVNNSCSVKWKINLGILLVDKQQIRISPESTIYRARRLPGPFFPKRDLISDIS